MLYDGIWSHGHLPAAGAAQPLGLDRRAADGEAAVSRRTRKDRGDMMILHFDHSAAFATDQELRGMRMTFPIGIGGAACNAADESR